MAETQGRYVTTHLVASVRPAGRRDLVRRWLAAHVELTEWIHQHPDEAKRLLNAELQAPRPTVAGGRAEPGLGTYQTAADPVAPVAGEIGSGGASHRISPTETRSHALYALELLNDCYAPKGFRSAVQTVAQELANLSPPKLVVEGSPNFTRRAGDGAG